MTHKRVVIWFSCGATSAVAAKIAVAKYRDVFPLSVICIDTGSEHDDSWRFLDDVSKWIDYPIEIIKNPKYDDTFDLYDKTGYLVGPYGARCSKELKRYMREQTQRVGDLQIFGYDSGEKIRANRFNENHPLVETDYPLIDGNISKNACFQLLKNNGIERPEAYKLGFKNNNCLKRGCVKGQMGYWNHIRKVFPNVFWNMAKRERVMGIAICRMELPGRQKVKVYLDELDPNAGNYNTEPAYQCSLFCDLPEGE